MSGVARVRLERQGAVVRVVVGDGRRRNALRGEDWQSLERCVRECAADPTLGAVLVAGHGRTFSAGSDMTEWLDADVDAVDETFEQMEAAFVAIEECPLPVVAALAGVAAGAGCQLALACDLVVMGAAARIGMPIARLGILASPAFAARVADKAGPALARDLYYTGRLLRADEALAAGLVARVVPDADVERVALEVASTIAGHPAAAVRAAKASISAVTAAGRPARPPAAGHAVDYEEFHARIASFLAPDSPAQRPAG